MLRAKTAAPHNSWLYLLVYLPVSAKNSPMPVVWISCQQILW